LVVEGIAVGIAFKELLAGQRSPAFVATRWKDDNHEHSINTLELRSYSGGDGKRSILIRVTVKLQSRPDHLLSSITAATVFIVCMPC